MTSLHVPLVDSRPARTDPCIYRSAAAPRRQQFAASIACVIGNHATLAPLTERFGIPFHQVPHQWTDAHDARGAVADVLARYALDYLVLAED